MSTIQRLWNKDFGTKTLKYSTKENKRNQLFFYNISVNGEATETLQF